VQIGQATYSTQFVVIPLNLLIDFIIWCAPWYLFFGLFKLTKDDHMGPKTTQIKEVSLKKSGPEI
jgi:hypothetical protein